MLGVACNVNGIKAELTLAIASRTASSLNWLMKRAEDASGIADICVQITMGRAWTVINTNLSIVCSSSATRVGRLFIINYRRLGAN